MLPLFYNGDVPLLEIHPELPETYIALICDDALMGPFGRIIGVKWMALVTNTNFSFIWSKDENIENETYMKGFIKLIDKKRNIENIPHFLCQETRDFEAYVHYLTLYNLTDKMSEEDFITKRQDKREIIKERFKKRKIEKEQEKEKNRLERLAKYDELSKWLENNEHNISNLKNKASDMAYRGEHYEATIIMKYCQKTFKEFNPEDYSWIRIIPICCYEGCHDTTSINMKARKERGSNNSSYLCDDPKDIRTKYCLEHNKCKKCFPV
jgi:hypothetical protein